MAKCAFQMIKEVLQLFYPSLREYLVVYRGNLGEVKAFIVAKSPEDAKRKFLKGQCEYEYQVNPEALLPEFVEVKAV
jgi:hypothetical protein